MTPLEQVIERLKQMSPERQEAFARLIMREIVADEQWQRSAAQAAEWKKQQEQSTTNGNPAPQSPPPKRPNEVVPFS